MNILIGTILLIGLALWCLRLLGRERLPQALAGARQTLMFTLPRICVALIGAGFFAELLPEDQVKAMFGEQSGIRALFLAAILGVVTPGGAFVSFAIGAAALTAGASVPAVMTYVTSWALFSLTRSLAYELPIMGAPAMRNRILFSWPIPFLVGAAALLLYAA